MDEALKGAVVRHEKSKLMAAESKDALKAELKAAIKEKRVTDKEAKEVQRLIGKE